MQPSLAQQSGTVTVDVEHCLGLESAAARRDCFGAQVDEMLEGRAAEDGSDSIPDEAAVIREQTPRNDPPRQEEGSAQIRAEELRGDEPRPADTDSEEYFATITAVRERLPNAYVITLDNGEVWQQMESRVYPLRPGLEVRLHPTRWGKSYRLIVEGTSYGIQVRRVR